MMNEFAFNLESFNPAFTATLLKVNRCRCTSFQRSFTAVSHPQHCLGNPASQEKKHLPLHSLRSAALQLCMHRTA